jgi:hypothetical protein
MAMRIPARSARHLARLYAARFRRAYTNSPESRPHASTQPECVRFVQFAETEKEKIADWEWAWIDLGGEG